MTGAIIRITGAELKAQDPKMIYRINSAVVELVLTLNSLVLTSQPTLTLLKVLFFQCHYIFRSILIIIRRHYYSVTKKHNKKKVRNILKLLKKNVLSLRKTYI